MEVLFTAVRVSLSGGGCRSGRKGGMTLTSEPVSIKKRMCVLLQPTYNRRLERWPEMFVSLHPAAGVPTLLS